MKARLEGVSAVVPPDLRPLGDEPWFTPTCDAYQEHTRALQKGYCSKQLLTPRPAPVALTRREDVKLGRDAGTRRELVVRRHPCDTQYETSMDKRNCVQ